MEMVSRTGDGMHDQDPEEELTQPVWGTGVYVLGCVECLGRK